ncbi:MAG: DUF1415 domain-containing protein [Pseudomonadota bacterium]
MRDDAPGDTLTWLERIVVGLNLCPFARPVLDADRLDIISSDAANEQDCLTDVAIAATQLLNTPRDASETALLVFTDALSGFDDFLRFTDIAQLWLADAQLDGVLQLALFHPDFRIEGAAPDAREQVIHRSPWPTIHLLRQISVTEAVASHPDTQAIPDQNQRRLLQIGAARWQTLFGSAAED